MFLSELSIRRPVFTTMVMAAFVVLGLFAYRRLYVEELPNVDFPVVTVTTAWPGASPEAVESDVTRKIEEALNTVAGVKQLSSQSLEGVSSVVVMFHLNIKTVDAANDVREKLARLRPDLPPDIKEPVIERLDPASRPILSLTLSSDRVSMRELTTLADDVLRKRLENVPGVGKVTLVGGDRREIEVLLDPTRLSAQGLTVSDVVSALRQGNLDLPAGRLVRGPRETLLRVAGRVRRVEDFADLPVRATSGAVVRLGDVADVRDGVEERRSASFLSRGHGTALTVTPAVALEVQKQSGANTVAVADTIIERLAELRAGLPDGVRLDVAINNSVFVKSSLNQVREDMVLGALLTVLIVYLFLHSWRSTVITGLTLPISVIGAFWAIWAAGFTLNQLTLMALTLAIGLLIDDAIVVRENIVRHAQMGKDHRTAAREGTAEIGLAVMATTLSIVAVFVPVAFMGGIVGRFFFQFGITVSVAVLISLFVSFTLDPMMSSVWPDPHAPRETLGWFGRAMMRWHDAFERLAQGYRSLLGWALRRRGTTLAITLGVFVFTLGLGPLIGFAFFPDIDRGEFLVLFRTPVGSSLQYSEKKAHEILAAIHQDPDVDYCYTTIGAGATGTVNQGQVYVKLRPRALRQRRTQQVRPDARARLQQLVDVRTQLVDAGGPAGPLAPLQISVKGPDLGQLDRVAQQVLAAVRSTPGVVDAEISQEKTRPEVRLVVDRQRAADLGVSVGEVAQVLRALITGELAGTFEDEEARTHGVRVRLPLLERRSPADIARLLVPGAPRPEGGRTLVSLEQVASLRDGLGPSQINHIDLQREVRITGNVEGRPLGNVSRDIRAAVDRLRVPAGYTVDLGGQSRDLKETIGYVLESLILAIVFIYLVLASQFESFLQPLAIMLSLPLSMVGVFLAMLATGGTMNIMTMIGLIMLMGLVTKNAILLVDHANQRRREGLPRDEALLAAGQVRLRPILMTTLAMIFGMVPLALALGEGSEFRSPMARAVIGGLISSTLLTLVVVPVVYTYLDSLGAWVLRRLRGEQGPSGWVEAERS
ncbi:MAG: efflux RND transporter permease subunit [Myxococcales bacterium]|nr:efflux RND transporter permease subunit [Myxococcota bacterium]MDW8283445.1 efflux RND transporter permease subunit [Myxococcales bacterium]